MDKYRIEIEIEHDDSMGEPWKEHDGHGPVSDWVLRDPEPGELLLCADRHFHRWYDYNAALEQAKREGWGPGSPEDAVKADYEHLRAWCQNEWYWVGVVVKVYLGDELIGHNSLCGIDDEKYAREEGKEMAQIIIEQFEEGRRTAWRTALATLRQRRAILARAGYLHLELRA